MVSRGTVVGSRPSVVVPVARLAEVALAPGPRGAVTITQCVAVEAAGGDDGDVAQPGHPRRQAVGGAAVAQLADIPGSPRPHEAVAGQHVAGDDAGGDRGDVQVLQAGHLHRNGAVRLVIGVSERAGLSVAPRPDGDVTEPGNPQRDRAGDRAAPTGAPLAEGCKARIYSAGLRGFVGVVRYR